jgi:hypothetical protein
MRATGFRPPDEERLSALSVESFAFDSSPTGEVVPSGGYRAGSEISSCGSGRTDGSSHRFSGYCSWQFLSIFACFEDARLEQHLNAEGEKENRGVF